MKKVLVTRKLIKENSERISKIFNVKLNDDDTIFSSDELLKYSKDCDGILTVDDCNDTDPLVGRHLDIYDTNCDGFLDKSFSVGGESNCLIKDDYTLACWGFPYVDDSYYDEGLGEYVDRTIENPVLSEMPDNKFWEISVSSYLACGITHTEGLKCWGNTAELDSKAYHYWLTAGYYCTIDDCFDFNKSYISWNRFIPILED